MRHARIFPTLRVAALFLGVLSTGACLVGNEPGPIPDHKPPSFDASRPVDAQVEPASDQRFDKPTDVSKPDAPFETSPETPAVCVYHAACPVEGETCTLPCIDNVHDVLVCAGGRLVLGYTFGCEDAGPIRDGDADGTGVGACVNGVVCTPGAAFQATCAFCDFGAYTECSCAPNDAGYGTWVCVHDGKPCTP